MKRACGLTKVFYVPPQVSRSIFLGPFVWLVGIHFNIPTVPLDGEGEGAADTFISSVRK